MSTSVTGAGGNRLQALRELMKQHNLDAYIVPSEDAHQSEYLAPCDERRHFITGFTGSAGCAVVTADSARLWTDGRYWLQAARQLDSDWTLMKQGQPGVPSWQKWVTDDFTPSSRVGIDPAVIPYSTADEITKQFAKESGSTLVPVKENLVDQVWTEKPARPANLVFHLDDKYNGETVGSKLSRTREQLKKIGSPGLVVQQLDEVAWLFNLRGTDIPYNPVFFAYAILTLDDCTLFLDPKAVDQSARDYLSSNGVAVAEYEQIWTHLQSLAKNAIQYRTAKLEEAKAAKETRKVNGHSNGEVDSREAKKPKLDTKPEEQKFIGELPETIVKTNKILVGLEMSWAVIDVLGADNVEKRRSVITDAKAKKNATEIEGFRQCHIRDGAALCRYFAWLEEALRNGEQWTEYDAAQKLEAFRKENELFQGLSFDTISSTGPNAGNLSDPAVIHYSPPEQGSAVIDINQIYLCDSGAQYSDGTTDTTRTWHFGTPSEEEKRSFTRVLQGNIALDTLIFPVGTTGYVIDVVARRPLWSDGLDYRHGTGHGVGSFLNVHEGPMGVGLRKHYDDAPLRAGHVFSNEPGYYADGKYGIRIENIDVCRIAQTRENFGDRAYLELENVTMCPIQTKLVLPELMSVAERDWLNRYHQEVKEKVTPVLERFQDERAIKWLEKECQPL